MQRLGRDHRDVPVCGLESGRWIEGYKRIAEMAAEVPGTRLVYVANREADMMELMKYAQDNGNPADWLICAKTNRALPGDDKLCVPTLDGELLGEIGFTTGGRDQKKGPQGTPATVG